MLISWNKVGEIENEKRFLACRAYLVQRELMSKSWGSIQSVLAEMK